MHLVKKDGNNKTNGGDNESGVPGAFPYGYTVEVHF